MPVHKARVVHRFFMDHLTFRTLFSRVVGVGDCREPSTRIIHKSFGGEKKPGF
jgi:hypothetical protein